uniref:Dickkopf WNT signaling pathway inhibitor 4 n=1 Tax=Varanus komodoensis TaxID=61221 RepID=A0A8D2JD37_VARKO
IGTLSQAWAGCLGPRGLPRALSSVQSTPCLTDRDCPAEGFCPEPGEEPPFCAACRGLRKRCRRNAMCCPGTLCLNGKQLPPPHGKRTRTRCARGHCSGCDGGGPPAPRPRQAASHLPPHLGACCLRTTDCATGLCCARHFWAKICKPVPTEGQVCSRRGQKAGARGHQIFQRCDCGPGLSCQQLLGEAPPRSRLQVCWRKGGLFPDPPKFTEVQDAATVERNPPPTL